MQTEAVFDNIAERIQEEISKANKVIFLIAEFVYVLSSVSHRGHRITLIDATSLAGDVVRKKEENTNKGKTLYYCK